MHSAFVLCRSPARLTLSLHTLMATPSSLCDDSSDKTDMPTSQMMAPSLLTAPLLLHSLLAASKTTTGARKMCEGRGFSFFEQVRYYPTYCTCPLLYSSTLFICPTDHRCWTTCCLTPSPACTFSYILLLVHIEKFFP